MLSIIGTGSFAAMSLLVGIVLTRNLAAVGFGQYALVVSSVGLVSVIGSMGLEGAFIYWINKRGMDIGAASTLMIRGAADGSTRANEVFDRIRSRLGPMPDTFLIRLFAQLRRWRLISFRDAPV